MKSGRQKLAALLMIVLIVGIPLAAVVPALAAIISVGHNGTEDYDSIQGAIDAAYDHDTINVAPGTYNESIAIDKPLTLRGAHGLKTKTAIWCRPITSGMTLSRASSIIQTPAAVIL